MAPAAPVLRVQHGTVVVSFKVPTAQGARLSAAAVHFHSNLKGKRWFLDGEAHHVLPLGEVGNSVERQGFFFVQMAPGIH